MRYFLSLRTFCRATCVIIFMFSAVRLDAREPVGAFGRPESVKIRVTSPALAADVESRGGRKVGDYGSFSVLEVEPSVLATVGDADEIEVLERQHQILLNHGALDTSQPPVRAMQRVRAAFNGKALHLVQFAGPVQSDWYDALAKTGARIISYIPNNAYLVYGDATSLAGVQTLAAGFSAIQWNDEFLPDYKLDPKTQMSIQALNATAPGGAASDTYQIQLVADPQANAATQQVIDAMKTEPIKSSFSILEYVNIVVRLPSNRVAELSSRPDVVSIRRYVERTKNDERQDQIIAGNLSGNVPTGPGYLDWLASKGFTQAQFTASGIVVDLSDSGIDNATTSPNHFGLWEMGLYGGNSRVVYNRLIGSPNYGNTLEGCDGHGTINSHIIGGFNFFLGFPFEDTAGYDYGLGVAPFIRLGSSVIFDPDFFTFPNYTTLQSRAYQDGARISSNSWGGDTTGDYDADTQTYDALVRDAQPAGAVFSAPGNQEMVIVFANGNAGPNPKTVGTPAGGKNVIAVGASENVNPFGANDGCGTGDNESNSANDMASFSSRGPTEDGRHKPDIVAPGTHITGGVFQTSTPSGYGTADPCFSAGGVCGGTASAFYPGGQQFYTSSTGTSHSTPAVAGGAALIRQFFINYGMSPPSPAMTKALLINAARYMTGTSANDTLWSNAQGMGEMDLGAALDRAVTPTFFRDQIGSDMMTTTGDSRTVTGTIADTSKPFRVTLAWTDAPGSTFSASYNNNLDLTLLIGGTIYRGNVFSGAYSVPGGSADAVNNVESIFLPAGTSGDFSVIITAANINSDGVPNVEGPLDQDYALVVFNAVPVNRAFPVASGSSLGAEAGSCPNNAIDPTETVTVNLGLGNYGSVATSDLVATLQASGGVTVPSGPQDYGVLPPFGPVVSRPFTFKASGTCGNTVTATLHLQDGATDLGNVTFSLQLGIVKVLINENFDSVAPPNLPAGWTTTVASGPATPWATTNSQSDTAPNSAFALVPQSSSDNSLISPTVSVVTSTARLTFRHNYNFNFNKHTFTFYDGGVLEISMNGGSFSDIISAGGTFVMNGYNGIIYFSIPLGTGRQVWGGTSGGYITTVVNLPASAAGKSVKFRWRIGSGNNSNEPTDGWYVDSVQLTDGYVCCTCPNHPPDPTGMTTNTLIVCPGECAHVNVALPPSGNSTNWYKDSGCAHAVSGGASTTVCPTADTMYYVQYRNNATRCTSACVPAFTIACDASAAPEPPTNLHAISQTICAGSCTTLTGTPGDGGDTISWFNDGVCFLVPYNGIDYNVCPGSTTTYSARTLNSSRGCISACTGPVTVTVQQCDTPAPSILSWASVRTHAGFGDVALPLDPTRSGNGQTGATVESRSGNLMRIAVTFDQPVTVAVPSPPLTYWQTVGGTINGPFTVTGQTTVVMQSQTSLEIQFPVGGGSGLPSDQAVYKFDLGGVVKKSAMNLIGDTDCYVRVLNGDTTGDGQVNLGDVLLIKTRAIGSLLAAPACDVDTSGTIDLTDAQIAKAEVTSPSRTVVAP